MAEYDLDRVASALDVDLDLLVPVVPPAAGAAPYLHTLRRLLAGGALSDYGALSSYDAASTTITLTVAGGPGSAGLALGTGFYFVAPDDVDDSESALRMAYDVADWPVVDINRLPLAPLDLTAGRIYEGRLFFLAGAPSIAIMEDVIARSGRYARYTLVTVRDPDDEDDDTYWAPPTASQYLNGVSALVTQSNPIRWDLDAVALPQTPQGFPEGRAYRVWFAVPFEDITEVVQASGFSIISNYRSWFGTPADPFADDPVEGSSLDPSPVMINGVQFYSFGSVVSFNNSNTFNLFRD